jgi:hypothetical protein
LSAHVSESIETRKKLRLSWDCKWKCCFFIARSLQHLLSAIDILKSKLWSEKAKIKLKENLFIKPFHVSLSASFFVNYRLMIVKNFINAIKVFVRLFHLSTRDANWKWKTGFLNNFQLALSSLSVEISLYLSSVSKAAAEPSGGRQLAFAKKNSIKN